LRPVGDVKSFIGHGGPLFGHDESFFGHIGPLIGHVEPLVGHELRQITAFI
jgi:hypothetical protein